MQVPNIYISTLVAFLLMILASIIHFETANSMINVWLSNTTFYHCFLVLPIFIAILIYKWREIAARPPAFYPIILPLLIISGFATVFFQRIGINLFAHFSFVILLQSCFMISMGKQITSSLRFPIFFLFFLIPFGTEFILILQNITAFFSVKMLDLSGVESIRQGFYIYTDRINFFVAEACAGLRFLIANIFVMSLYSYFTYKSIKLWSLFIIISIILPVIGNIFRAYGIMLIGYYSDGELATGIDHFIYGWGFFTFIAIVNFVLGEYLRKYDITDKTDNISDEGYYAYGNTYHSIIQKKHLPATIFALLTSWGLTYHLNILEDKNISSPVSNIRNIMPNNINNLISGDDWIKTEPYPFYFKNYDLVKSYYNSKKDITAGFIHYNNQNSKKEALGYHNRFYDEEKWMLLGQKKIVFNDIRWIAELSGHFGKHKKIVFYSYYTGNPPIFSIDSLNIKFQTLKSLFTSGNSSGGVFYMTIPIEHDMHIEKSIDKFKEILG